MSGLPAWLAPLSDAERCREADSWAISERGVPSLTLMENASQGVARLVQETVPAGRVVVACGGGNNGGDGYATARILRSMGREVVVLEAADPGRLSPDAAAQRTSLPGPPPAAFSAEWLEGAAVIVDALLGTGFTGKPRGAVGKAIKAIAASGIPVVSVDIPSGIDASTGEAGGDFVKAFATATFLFDKVGLHINPGRDAAGFVRVLEIGIPEGAPVEPADVGLIEDAGVLALVPRRGPRSNKFTSGHVYVAGGSVGLTGATVLASRAAARAGAGYVTACVPASEQPVVACHLLEEMQMPLPSREGHLRAAGSDTLAGAVADRPGAVALGPGLGGSDGARAFARRLVREARTAMVIDADGLNAFAGDAGQLRKHRGGAVCTPHEGELARLLGTSSRRVRARRLEHVRKAASRSGTVVVLKGVDTLVAAPDGTVGVSPGASPALATAGTGDVLSGVIASMLARDLEPFAAACAGVRLHARAGGLAAEAIGPEGVVAGDVIAALPRAWA